MTDIKFNSNEKSEPSIANNEGTQRKLEARHITMIAGIFFITKVGGTIGTGLLVSTGGTLAEAGAMGALIAYLIAGLAIYFVVNSLGEMATLIPITGSFNAYAARFVDPALGFACGWIYWFGWVTTFPLELIACGGFLKFWLPGVDKYLLMSLVLVSRGILNCFAVKGFGEMVYSTNLSGVLVIFDQDYCNLVLSSHNHLRTCSK